MRSAVLEFKWEVNLRTDRLGQLNLLAEIIRAEIPGAVVCVYRKSLEMEVSRKFDGKSDISGLYLGIISFEGKNVRVFGEAVLVQLLSQYGTHV